ncbi:DUF5994 family protein [Amycolatopsis aidingensis]|uniref:DUF5994 family protein n=1 Tax=Amycolatopsis aidingensis TaxID=2842453 RepID=UPI001E2889A6|nr:DUF5994 family protein [Amycolatopsis aidingensis]
MAVVPSRARLKLKPQVASSTGFVDGAWWPRSRNLCAELPALLAALGPRLGRVERVTYNLSVWDLAVRKAPVGNQVVRLDGFFSQAPDLVTVVGAGGRRLTLLVVPPDTAGVAAHRVLMTASTPDNVDGTDVLLAARPVAAGGDSADEPDMAAERWEGDGGRMYEHA